MSKVPDKVKEKVTDTRQHLNARYGHQIAHAEHLSHPVIYGMLFAGWHEAYVWAGGAAVFLFAIHYMLSGDDE